MERFSFLPSEWVGKYFGRWILLLLICSSLTSLAQDSLSRAANFTQNQQYNAAEQVYDQLLQTNPDHSKARSERAILRSWQGKYDLAEIDFLYLLERDPNNSSVRNSYGYSLAWSGNYVSGESQFRKILTAEPNHSDAAKGLAYVALWKGKEKLAVSRFERLASADASAEVLIGMGQSYLLSGQQKKARRAFENALTLNPNQSGGKELLRGAQTAPAYLELTLWSGYSQVDDQNKWGFRAGELALQPNHRWRFWLRYDNSLSLDNLGLLQSQRSAPGYFAGAMAIWKQKFSTKLETGTRELPEGVRQMTYLGEQVVFLKNDMSLKFGGLWAPKDNGEKEWMAYGGFSFPASEAFSVEPLYFHSRNLQNDDLEQRLLLNGYYKLQGGFQINAGIIYGQVQQSELDNTASIYGGNLMVTMPLGHVHWLNMLLRYESSQVFDFFTASLGLKFRLER